MSNETNGSGQPSKVLSRSTSKKLSEYSGVLHKKFGGGNTHELFFKAAIEKNRLFDIDAMRTRKDIEAGVIKEVPN